MNSKCTAINETPYIGQINRYHSEPWFGSLRIPTRFFSPVRVINWFWSNGYERTDGFGWQVKYPQSVYFFRVRVLVPSDSSIHHCYLQPSRGTSKLTITALLLFLFSSLFVYRRKETSRHGSTMMEGAHTQMIGVCNTQLVDAFNGMC